MLQEFLKAFCLVFIAEIGDKSQILAMTFATKYKAAQVVIGISFGIIFNHLLAIIVGIYISNIIPLNLLQILAGVLFVIFGFIAFKKEKNINNNNKSFNIGVTTSIAIAFFLGELGDKTQLTAMTLAMEGKWPLIILAGTTIAMICVGCVGIFIIKSLNKKIPTYIIKIISGLVFIFLGMTKIFQASHIFINNKTLMAIFIVTVAISSLFMTSKLLEESK